MTTSSATTVRLFGNDEKSIIAVFLVPQFTFFIETLRESSAINKIYASKSFIVKFILHFKSEFLNNFCKAQQTSQADFSQEILHTQLFTLNYAGESEKNQLSANKQNWIWIEVPADFHWQQSNKKKKSNHEGKREKTWNKLIASK